MSQTDITSATTATTAATSTTSTVMSTMADIRYNPLSLPRFSGTVPTPKTESSFRVWKHTLNAIIVEESLTENRVKQLIRRSLTGEAAESLIALPSDAKSEDIIQELSDSYGITTAKIDGWAAFHAATQGPTESITEWKMKLIRLYEDADPEKKFADHRDSMLATALWTNLCNKDLRIATSADRKESFSTLFRSIKANEPLYTSKTVKPTKATTQRDNDNSELKTLQNEMKALKLQNEELQKQLKSRSNRKIICYFCDTPGHVIRDCPMKKTKSTNFNRQGREGASLSGKQ